MRKRSCKHEVVADGNRPWLQSGGGGTFSSNHTGASEVDLVALAGQGLTCSTLCSMRKRNWKA